MNKFQNTLQNFLRGHKSCSRLVEKFAVLILIILLCRSYTQTHHTTRVPCKTRPVQEAVCHWPSCCHPQRRRPSTRSRRDPRKRPSCSMALEAFLNGQKPKHSQPDEQDASLRFKLDLKEPTDETTNEFSYVLLVQSARDKVPTTLHPTVAYSLT